MFRILVTIFMIGFHFSESKTCGQTQCHDTLEIPYCCNKTGGSMEEGQCCCSRSQSTYVGHCSHPMLASTGLPWWGAYIAISSLLACVGLGLILHRRVRGRQSKANEDV
ncbi:uncharacterized protein LOC127843968 [Dreissena polymorpha]|uniref:Uncharacterized protein n=1 Tax=Dreissena polymorpha TaxID=45954 RepID=A0A9D4IKE3_DREPO|nr:uncharacterized protein LOC127843968 [Dreissena polymorpha]KAH3777575.1 hypothetical protein DPMN_179023 [Dreissena polymorpha]